MEEVYYLDSSIWLDMYEKRGKNSEEALRFLEKIIRRNCIILYSALHIKELKYLGYSFGEIAEMFSFAKKNLRKVHICKQEKEQAKNLAIKRKIPRGDALHAILSRNNEAQLISRDRDFENIKDVVIAKKPEEIL